MRTLIQNGTIITFGTVLPGARRPRPAHRGRPHRAHRAQGGAPGPLRQGDRRQGQGGDARARERAHALLLHPGAGPGQGRAELRLPGGAREPLVAPGQEAEPGRHLLQRQGDAGGGHQEGHHDPHRSPCEPGRRAGLPGPHRQGGEGDGPARQPLLRALGPRRRQGRGRRPGGERRLRPALQAGERPLPARPLRSPRRLHHQRRDHGPGLQAGA